MSLKKIAIITMASMVSACVAGQSSNVLESAIETQPTSQFAHKSTNSLTTDSVFGENITPKNKQNDRIAFASETINIVPIPEKRFVPPPPPPRVKKTYLINGLASNVKSIGYGFTNLSKKIPDVTLHNYASFVESSTVIRTKVIREIKAAYEADPTIEINLIGISFGANIVTWIAQELNRKDIPIHYLATLEGPAMAPIYDNVRLADNFSCTGASCFRTSSKLAWKNKKTDFSSFKIKVGHIGLADHPEVHARVLSQINKHVE